MICTSATEVHELGDPTIHDAGAAEIEAGQAVGTRILNMPGPAYGNPGYKESHNWESDIDIFSPIIFNPKYYAAKYEVTGGEAEVRADWKTTGLAADLAAPDCRQGTADFSLNTYLEKNPGVQESTGGLCAKLLENYLGQGLFDGLSGATNHKILREGAGDYGVTKQEIDTDLVDKDKIVPSQEYTLSFWLKLADVTSVETNILHYGDEEYKRSPAIYAKAGTTNLKFSISQDNEQDFHCSLDGEEDPGALEKKKWYGITMVVNSNGADIYVNGEKKAECSNPDGQTITPAEGTNFYLSDPWTEAARAEIQGLTYYSGYKMSEAELQVQTEIEKEALK
jgi:hypothetical protein